MADYLQRVPQIDERNAGGRLPLPNLPLQFARPSLCRRPISAFQSAQFGIEVNQLIGNPLDIPGKILPSREMERDAANGLGSLDFAAIQLPVPPADQFLIRHGDGGDLICQLLLLLVKRGHLREKLKNLASPLALSQRAFFDITK